MGDFSEWDNILDKFGEADDLWHCKGRYFWGQEKSPFQENSREAHVVRGFLLLTSGVNATPRTGTRLWDSVPSWNLFLQHLW